MEFLPKDTVNRSIAIPVFTTGPHQDIFIFQDKTQFGHYNPEFLQWFNDIVVSRLEDPLIRAATKSSFDKHFLELSILAFHSYRKTRTEKFEDYRRGIQEYLSILDENKTKIFSTHYKNPATAFYLGYKGPPWHEIEEEYLETSFEEREHMRRAIEGICYGRCAEDTMAFFWARRDIDGTSKLWIDIITRLLQLYKPTFVKDQKPLVHVSREKIIPH